MAAFDGYCEIRRAGISSDGLAQLDLKAVDGTFDWTWFFSAENLGREMLAVALAAIVSNKKVEAAMNDTAPAIAGDGRAAAARVTRFFLGA